MSASLLFLRFFDGRNPQAARDVSASQGTLIDTFERIADLFRRFETYIEDRPTTQITDIIVNIMLEMTHILALVTREIRQGRLSVLISDDRPSLSTYCYTGRFLRKVAGRSDIEDSLHTLDQLTQEACRMMAAEVLKVTHRAFHVDERVMGADKSDLGDQKRSSRHISCSVIGNRTSLVLQ